MFKLFVFAMLMAVASAGLIGGYGHGGALLAAPAVVHAPVIAAPVAYKSVATSYANSNSIALNPVPVAVHHAAPLVHAAPVLHAAPLVLGHGYGH